MANCFFKKFKGVVSDESLQKFDSLYIEATNGPFTTTTMVIPVAANPKALSGDVTFTYQWQNPQYKALEINSTGPAKVEIENYFGSYYIRLNPYATIFKIENIVGLGFVGGFDSERIDEVYLQQCMISGNISLLRGKPVMKKVYIQDKSGKLFGDISTLGENIGMTHINLYGNTNIIGDEDALFDALAANGKTTSMSFDFTRTKVISSGNNPLSGTVTFSGGSWTIQ